MKGSIVNIETIVLANKYFRQVLYTARIDKVHHFTPLRGKIYGKNGTLLKFGQNPKIG